MLLNNQELQRQKAEYDARRKRAEQLRLTVEKTDERRDVRSSLSGKQQDPPHDGPRTTVRSQSAMYAVDLLITNDSYDKELAADLFKQCC